MCSALTARSGTVLSPEALELAAIEAARDADELEVEKVRERRKTGPVKGHRSKCAVPFPGSTLSRRRDHRTSTRRGRDASEDTTRHDPASPDPQAWSSTS